MIFHKTIKNKQGVFMHTPEDISIPDNYLAEEVKSNDPIEHVIVLMLENHSFDKKLGCFKQKYSELEGVDPNFPAFNLDDKNAPIYQIELAEKQVPLDPFHELPNVMAQLDQNNSGFVKDFIANYPKSSQLDRQYIMSYYPMGSLPAMHGLANDFTICDNWFASVPSGTWPNRFFALSGSSRGRVITPNSILDPEAAKAIFYQNQPTIFDSLNNAGKSWRVYFEDFPISLVFTHQRFPRNLIHYHRMKSFYKDANGDPKDFPNFTFIEPKYEGDDDQNDDHPPHNTMKAEKLIADVYNAVRANKKLWQSSLLVITYDEHGGFYDHVSPPTAIPPDAHTEEYTFDRLGIRVPTILVSPWVDRRVEKTLFDHTSVLKYLIDKWQLQPLGNRTANANSISVALNFKQTPRKDCISHIYIPTEDIFYKNSLIAKWNINSNHLAIHSFINFLKESENYHPTHSAKRISRTAIAGEKLGKKIEKFGIWLQKKSYQHRIKEISYTQEIVDYILNKGNELSSQEEKSNDTTTTTTSFEEVSLSPR